jgi:hypothetical protein
MYTGRGRARFQQLLETIPPNNVGRSKKRRQIRFGRNEKRTSEPKGLILLLYVRAKAGCGKFGMGKRRYPRG